MATSPERLAREVLRDRRSAPPPAGETETAKLWPGSCLPPLKDAYVALEGLQTKEALERCGRLRHKLRVLAAIDGGVHSFGPMNGEPAWIDTVAAEAARCDSLGDPPEAAVALARVVVPQVLTPITFPDVNDSKRKGGVCRTLGGAIPSGVRCQALAEPVQISARPLLSLSPDANTWFLDSSKDKGNVLRSEGGSSLSVKGYYSLSEAFAYVDAEGIARGQAHGQRLIRSQSGEPVEQPVSGLPTGMAFRGDMALVIEKGALRVQRIANDGKLSDLIEIPQVERIDSLKACHDGSGFGFMSYGEGEAVAAIPRADGGFDVGRVKVDVDAMMDGRNASISCRQGQLALTWLSRDSRIRQVVCTPKECVAKKSEVVSGRHAVGVAPLVLDLAGQVLLIRYARQDLGFGVTSRIVYRLASIETVHRASDRLLIAEGRDDASPRELFIAPKAHANGAAAVVAVSAADGFYLFRVDKDGSAHGLAAE